MWDVVPEEIDMPGFNYAERPAMAPVTQLATDGFNAIKMASYGIYETNLTEEIAGLAASEIIGKCVRLAKDIGVTVPQLENSQKVSLAAKLLDPKDALKSYDGLFSNEFVR